MSCPPDIEAAREYLKDAAERLRQWHDAVEKGAAMVTQATEWFELIAIDYPDLADIEDPRMRELLAAFLSLQAESAEGICRRFACTLASARRAATSIRSKADAS